MKNMQTKSWITAASIAAVLPLASAQGPFGDTVPVEPSHPLLWLGLITLGLAIIIVFWHLFRLRKAKRTREHSSLSRGDVKTDPNKS